MGFLPELVPKARSKRSWIGHVVPRVDCSIFRNSNGTTPRTPPPSTLRIRGLAVGGLKVFVMEPNPHNIHCLSLYLYSDRLTGVPKIRIHTSQKACPQLSTFSGIRRTQEKQVRLLFNCFNSGAALRKHSRCIVAGGTLCSIIRLNFDTKQSLRRCDRSSIEPTVSSSLVIALSQ